MALERVQKILARAGIASRRKAEELVALGEVTINGVVAKLGDQAEWGKDAIKVSGKLLTATEQPVYLAFYKPKNVICAMNDPEGRPALGDYFVRVKARIYPIGKLGFGSEGLVLLTNDGDMAQKLTQATESVQVYSVKVKGSPDTEMLKRLSRGMRTEKGHLVRPEVVRLEEKFENKAKIQLVMRGTALSELKDLFETRGFLVDKIIRTAIGQVTLGELEPGKYRRLEASQIRAIFEQPELGMKPIASAVEKDAERAARRRRDDARRAERAEARVERSPERKPRGASKPSPITPRSSSTRTAPRGRPAAATGRDAPSTGKPVPAKGAWGSFRSKSAPRPRSKPSR